MGSFTANPIAQNGVVYLQDLGSDVYALALTTGRLEWEYQCDQPKKSEPGPNGVAVAGGKVYGLTPTAAFALSSGADSTHGEVEALSLATGKIEWDRKLSQLPLGAVTVSNDPVLRTLDRGVLH